MNDNVDEDILQHLSKSFYDSDYDISLINEKHIHQSDWFYDENNIGSKIKSLVELLVGKYKKDVALCEFENEKIQLLFEVKRLGRFYFILPMLRAGREAIAWIDSSTLMLRLRIPQLIKDDDMPFYIKPKTDDDVAVDGNERQ